MPTELTLKELAEAKDRDLGASPWVRVDQRHIDLFAEATGDHQWIHVDPEAAKAGPFGGTIAHGYLSLSLVTLMFSELVSVQGIRMGVNYGLNRLRFPAPVPVGSRIRLAGKVAAVEEISGDSAQVQVDLTVELEGSAKPACVAQAIYRYYA